MTNPATADPGAGPRACESRLPNLLCIGAAKAGTTWLANVLAHHPQIYMPPQKELNALHYRDLDRRLEEYMAYFDAAGARPVRCDFSVRYIDSDRAAEAAARLAPAAKLLAVLRNPVDQIQSHYWHLLRQNFHQAEPVWPAPELFEALERYPGLLLDPALYGKHLERWLEHFPRSSLMVIEHSELRRSPAPALARLCEFLEIAPFDFSAAAAATSATEGRAGVQPRGGGIGRLFPTIYVSIARGPYQWLKETIGVRRTETLKRALRLRQVSEAVFFKTGYPKLDAAGRKRLYEIVRGDLDRLAALDLIDIERWRQG
jgi:hypothetical protein